MRLKIVLLCVAFFWLTGVGGAVSSAVAQPEFPPCQTTPHPSVGVHHEVSGKWVYDHHVVWCVEEGEIIWWESVVTTESLSCLWQGDKDIPIPVPNSKDLTIMNVGTFLCPDDGGARPRYENPWSIIGISPSGRSWVQAKGIA